MSFHLKIWAKCKCRLFNNKKKLGNSHHEQQRARITIILFIYTTAAQMLSIRIENYSFRWGSVCAAFVFWEEKYVGAEPFIKYGNEQWTWHWWCYPAMLRTNERLRQQKSNEQKTLESRCMCRPNEIHIYIVTSRYAMAKWHLFHSFFRRTSKVLRLLEEKRPYCVGTRHSQTRRWLKNDKFLLHNARARKQSNA